MPRKPFKPVKIRPTVTGGKKLAPRGGRPKVKRGFKRKAPRRVY